MTLLSPPHTFPLPLLLRPVFNFNVENFVGVVGFAVIETNDDAVILDRAEEILVALAEVKRKKNFAIIFLAVFVCVYM